MDVRGSTNRELFAAQSGEILETLDEGIGHLSNGELADMMHHVSGELVKYEKGELLLTDDKAPVELLGMSVIDGLIQQEIGYYKQIFEQDGIQGILNSM